MNWRHAIDTYRGHTIPHVDVIGHRRRWFILSGVLILLSLVGLFARGLNFSIDFEGGQEITYVATTALTVEDVTATLDDDGVTGATVQIDDTGTVSIRAESLASNTQEAAQVLGDLADQAGIERADISVKDVGASWGGEISSKAIRGLVIVLAAITLYIALRFEWAMAVGAMVALVHDVVITAGIYALIGREVTPETVIAILTILGFSLYDTVVIYDKVKENTESSVLVARHGYRGVVNLSLNQTLMRSVNTSLVVLLPILSLLLFGGETLKNFAFAMFVGVAIGAYSSIFVAAPVLTLLKERDPRYRQMEARRAAREEAAAVQPAISSATTGAAATAASARAGSSRPRPKSRRPPAKRRRR